MDALSECTNHGLAHSVTLETVVHAISCLASACDHGHDFGQHFTSGSKTSEIRGQNETTKLDLDLAFKLDDESQVKGQRELLVSRSSVFKAMLQGHYCESKQSVVRIRNASFEAFQLFLNWIHSRCTGFLAGTEWEDKERLPVLLEVLALCDQYLVLDIQQSVSEHICSSILSVDNALRVVECALTHNSTWLARQGLLYMARHPVPQCRLQMFQDLVACEHSPWAIKELRNSLAL